MSTDSLFPEPFAAEILRWFWFRVDTGWAPGDLVVVVREDNRARDEGPFVAIETRATVAALLPATPFDPTFEVQQRMIERVAVLLLRRYAVDAPEGALVLPLVWCESVGGRDVVVEATSIVVTRDQLLATGAP